jgi:hypothetical protein
MPARGWGMKLRKASQNALSVIPFPSVATTWHPRMSPPTGKGKGREPVTQRAVSFSNLKNAHVLH